MSPLRFRGARPAAAAFATAALLGAALGILLTEGSRANSVQLDEGVQSLAQDYTDAAGQFKSIIGSTGPVYGTVRLCQVAKKSGRPQTWIAVTAIAGRNIDALGNLRRGFRSAIEGDIETIETATNGLSGRFQKQAALALGHMKAGWRLWFGFEGTHFNLLDANRRGKAHDCGAAEDLLAQATSDNEDARDEFALGLKQIRKLQAQLPRQA